MYLDINECSGDVNCGVNAQCINTLGSYECQCNTGYSWDGTQCIGKNKDFLLILISVVLCDE